jgi:ATP/maltotriose-dependent transcriptional regulator MalT
VEDRPAIFGRANELARLRSAARGIRAGGPGRLLLIAGESGIGKSRLVSCFADETRDAGRPVGWGACRETEGAPAYWPWTQVLRAITAIAAADDPVLRPLLHPEEASAQTDRFLLFDAVTNTLAERARVEGLVLVLDDLHRADEASLALLRFLTASLHTAPLLLIGTYRDTELPAEGPLHRLIVDFADDEVFELVELRGLDTEDTTALAAREGAELGPPEVAALRERTGGNPFFVTELIRLAAHGGAGVPSTVQAALRARLAVLPNATRELLLLAAVAGRDLDPQLLADASGRREQDIHAMLAEAVAARIVEPHPGRPDRYRFCHALVQETLYSGLDPPRRLVLHGKIAAGLDRLVGSDPGFAADVAHHAGRAITDGPSRTRARLLAVRAGSLAEGRLADEDAVAWYTSALALNPAKDEGRIELLLGAGRCAGRCGDTAVARRAFEQAWRTAREQDSPPGLVAAALGLGEVVVSAGTVDEGLIHMLERTLAVLGRADPRASAQLTARLAMELYWSPALARSRDLAAEAVSAARTLGDTPTLASALAARQFVLRGPDDLATRIALGEELTTLAAELDDDDLELHARRMLIPDQLQHDLAAADAELGALGALAERSRRPVAQWYHLHFRATRAIMSGDPDEAWQLISDSEALGHRIAAQPATLYAAGQRFLLLRDTGRVADAEAETRREAARWPLLVIFRCMLTLLLADRGRLDEAHALLDELTADECAALPRDSLWLAGVAHLSEAAAVLDSAEHAAALSPVLLPYAGRLAMQGVVGWYGAVDRYLALLATTLGNWSEAETRFRAALRLHETWAAPRLIAATLAEHAAMLRRRGRPGDRQRATHLHTQTARRVPTSRAGPDGLTERENEILTLLAAGHSNKDIARRLYLSVHTVQRHIANVYSKIGAHNRAEATAYVLHR